MKSRRPHGSGGMPRIKRSLSALLLGVTVCVIVLGIVSHLPYFVDSSKAATQVQPTAILPVIK